MTARDVARRVGVSPSLISQIERDKVNPSVSTLWGLVTVLGLTMSDLFPESGPPGPRPAAAAGTVTRGRLGVRVGFEEYELTPGMAISFDSSSPHRLWSIGDEPAEAVWVVV